MNDILACFHNGFGAHGPHKKKRREARVLKIARAIVLLAAIDEATAAATSSSLRKAKKECPQRLSD